MIQRNVTTLPPSLNQQSLALLYYNYLFALPNHGLGQVMTKSEFHAHMALRLLMPQFSGLKICSRPTCHRDMDSFGYHALCCTGQLMTQRHDTVAWALHILASNADLQSKWKAKVSCLGTSWQSTGRNHTGLTAFKPADILLNWNHRPTCVDITVVSPINSNMPVTFIPGKSAQTAEDHKIFKHSTACESAGLKFLPFAVDCLGVLAPMSRYILKQLAFHLSIARGYPLYLAKQLINRRISFAIHLGTAKQIVGRLETS
jgi:hypothetical protein